MADFNIGAELIESMATDFVKINETEVQEEGGGFIEGYTEGFKFKAAIPKDRDLQAEVAEKQGVTSVYTLVYAANVPLKFHSIVKRLKDGQYFRITGNPIDSEAPKVATFAFRSVRCEHWELGKANE